MTLFSRNVRLVIENENGENIATLGDRAEAKDLRGNVSYAQPLQIEFGVERSLELEPNTLVAKVLNLSENNRRALEQSGAKTVRLLAWYGLPQFRKPSSEDSTIFYGDIRRIYHIREGLDIQTVIEAGDGDKAAAVWTRKRFAANTELINVLRTLLREAGLSAPPNLANTLALARSKMSPKLPSVFKNGLTVDGYALEEVHNLLKDHEIEFSIQNGSPWILIRGSVIDTQSLLLSSGSGLVGVPSPIFESPIWFERIDNKKPKTRRSEIRKVSFSSLMMAGVYPGVMVALESEFSDVSGYYRVVSASYNGSTHGSDFTISGEAELVEKAFV